MNFSKIFLILWTYILRTVSIETTNCVGCFNPDQGVCLLNPDDTCEPITKSQ